MTAGRHAPVVVVGASLGGLAAAVRLAKLGHPVTLVDQQEHPTPAVPDLIELPAAWRDLFRKSGRILDAALAEDGLDLVPAPPTILSDGVALPTDRGEQYAVLSEAYGADAADTWRDLLDALDDTWQVVRRLGLEAEFDPDDPRSAGLLRDRTSVADLATRVAPTALADHVRAVATDRGVDPAHAPGWWATRLCVRRTFGLWQLVDAHGAPQPGATLSALLLARAERRTVTRVTATVKAITLDAGGLTVTTTRGADLPAAAVISAVDLWSHRSIVGGEAPAVPRRLGPVPLHARPLTLTATGTPRWEHRDTWRALEPVTGRPHLAYAGSGTIAGDLPWARLLVGALATYEVHAALTGADVRPANRSGHRPRAARVAGSA